MTDIADSALDPGQVRASVEGRRILITGAGGSIGSALARSLAQLGPEQLVLLDAGELGLHQLEIDLRHASLPTSPKLIVGSVCNVPLLQELFDRERPQIVFHAAACKHVPLMERNPFTAAATNALGTMRLLEAASDAEQCILLSTDKAVDPASIMGATKRIAELIFLVAAMRSQHKVLRLGNVLGSSGSVLPTFLDQIARGGPVTVSHPDATRYFVSIERAVQALQTTLLIDSSPTIFVPEMGSPHRIVDLAQSLIDRAAENIEIVFTGLRPGDKLTEELVSRREVLSASAMHGLRSVGTSSSSLSISSEGLEQLAHAVDRRHLPKLLVAISALVPEYQPSDLLQVQLDASSEVHPA